MTENVTYEARYAKLDDLIELVRWDCEKSELEIDFHDEEDVGMLENKYGLLDELRREKSFLFDRELEGVPFPDAVIAWEQSLGHFRSDIDLSSDDGDEDYV